MNSVTHKPHPLHIFDIPVVNRSADLKDENILHIIKSYHVQENADLDKCVICLNEMVPSLQDLTHYRCSDNVPIHSLKHVFHLKCAIRAQEVSRKCPICRTEDRTIPMPIQEFRSLREREIRRIDEQAFSQHTAGMGIVLLLSILPRLLGNDYPTSEKSKTILTALKIFIASASCIKYFYAYRNFGMREFLTLGSFLQRSNRCIALAITCSFLWQFKKALW